MRGLKRLSGWEIGMRLARAAAYKVQAGVRQSRGGPLAVEVGLAVREVRGYLITRYQGSLLKSKHPLVESFVHPLTPKLNYLQRE
jgi:hypothetical protein